MHLKLTNHFNQSERERRANKIKKIHNEFFLIMCVFILGYKFIEQINNIRLIVSGCKQV